MRCCIEMDLSVEGITMKAKSLIILSAIAGLLLATVPVLAHHSFAAEFDPNQPMTATGVVTKVEWMNPHTHFYIDVKDDSGKVVNWDIETGSPNALARRGWTRNSLKVGDTVMLDAFRAKDGSSLASARNVKLSDGRKISAGSADEAVPTPRVVPPNTKATNLAGDSRDKTDASDCACSSSVCLVACGFVPRECTACRKTSRSRCHQ